MFTIVKRAVRPPLGLAKRREFLRANVWCHGAAGVRVRTVSLSGRGP
ncbi:hypothetical protein FRUB_06692 [Fimbriiglobus ruber]|uniref:Uncharacterized protein n=1 Tax=Fimbriiglobus ruber TaxID=1908690 RepID=A0A225D7Z1_9BACT|nr:hypothetical protein FRUB_06692 [Fimbriiglobus ruber]